MNGFEEQEYTKKFDAGLWKKLFFYIKAYNRQLIMLCATMCFVAVGDAAFPLLTKYAIDTFFEKRQLETLPIFITGYLILMVFQSINIFVFIKNAGRIETGIVYDIRKRAFYRLQELSFSYYDVTPVGWIMARLTSDAQRIGDVIAWGCVDIFWALAILMFSVVCMFIMNVKMTLLTLSVFPVLLLASLYFQKKIFGAQRKVRKYNSQITGAFNEGINGARTTKTLTSEERNFDEFKTLTSSMKSASVRAAILSGIYLPVVISLGSISVGLVLWSGGEQYLRAAISFGTLSVFVSYALQIYEPIQQVARVFSELQSAQAAAERTISLIETQPDITDSPEIIEKFGDALNPRHDNWPDIKGDVVFENVCFSYKNGALILENFNLHVRPGEKIALVGETGSGKSTIVNLLCRFYEPVSGRILIDGTDYRKRSQIWLQSSLGYVLQTPHLFSGSVMDNIRYAKLDATDEEVMDAARTVNAYDFIMKMRDGFDTDVGEGGNRLSAGERQLVSFARAILNDPRIVVLDEATSSIDTETEQVIQSAVDSVLKGRTSFIVAHRLSTIRNCDRILVISQGKIIESGDHHQLIKKRGSYYNLYTNQYKKEREDLLLKN